MKIKCPACHNKTLVMEMKPVEGEIPTLYKVEGICSCGYKARVKDERWKGLK